MKMHSYITVNGQLQYVTERATGLRKRLRKATERVGGWDKAMATAKARQMELDATDNSSQASTPPYSESNGSVVNGNYSGTPQAPEGSTSSYVSAKTASALRQRLIAVAAQDAQKGTHAADATVLNVQQLAEKRSNGGVVTTFVGETDLPEGVKPHPLVVHPDAEISSMATDYSELQSELVSSGPNYVRWEDTITWKNFAVYQLIPTLVYELEYPRTDKIRPLYVFEKTVATFGTFALLYTVTESWILPYANANQSFFRALLDLALPFMVAYLLLFFIIFGMRPRFPALPPSLNQSHLQSASAMVSLSCRSA